MDSPTATDKDVYRQSQRGDMCQTFVYGKLWKAGPDIQHLNGIKRKQTDAITNQAMTMKQNKNQQMSCKKIDQ